MIDLTPEHITELEKKLLAFGGERALVVNDDKDIPIILKYGRIFGPTSRCIKGRPHRCHENVRDACRKNSRYRAYCGYALSDGRWVEHSWVMGPGDERIETTVPREKYFGVAWVSLGVFW